MDEDRLRHHVAKLAEIVSGLAQERQQVGGELIVLTAAVHALVRTHPDAQGFATAFRRAWLELGHPHSSDETDSPALRGIDLALASLEQACAVPLKVRPPRAQDADER